MATRAIWKGAVSFGLVYIPVELHSAVRSGTLDLDLLDRRDFAPVGYQRYNKRTGKVVEWSEIVKGYQYKKGEYVALSDEDFRQANVKATQTIEIESFTAGHSIAREFYETPYYLAPTKGGEKGYSLLRETMKRSDKVAVGSIVMRGRQHLSVIAAEDRALVLTTLRFADEIRPASELDLPTPAKGKVTAREVDMAQRLVEEMSGPWNPEAYHDTYRDDLMKRINEKVRKKQTHVLTPKEKAPRAERQSAQVIDLMSVLKKSLATRGEHRRPARRAAAPGRRRRSS